MVNFKRSLNFRGTSLNMLKTLLNIDSVVGSLSRV